jgi:hypothetical protein
MANVLVIQRRPIEEIPARMERGGTPNPLAIVLLLRPNLEPADVDAVRAPEIQPEIGPPHASFNPCQEEK